MSYLNVNSANQQEVSGKLVVAFQSGGAVQVVISPSLTSTTFANVLDPDVDTRAIGNNSLNVIGYNYGYDEVNDVWARLRAIGGSGDAYQNNYSGYSLLTTIGEGGDIANVSPNTDIDTHAVSGAGALNVIGKNYGYHGARNVWTRIRSALSSGSNNGDATFSGYSLIVSMGDQGNIAHTTPTLTDGENANNSLFTAAFNMGYYHNGGYWSTIAARPDGTTEFSLSTHPAGVFGTLDVTTNNDVTGASGGEVLGSLTCRGPTRIQARSTNSGYIAVGGNNAGDFPSSSQGYRLAPGESIILYVSDWNVVSVFAQASGDAVSALTET